MDSETSLQHLKDKVQKFCTEREWDQFHNAKDLAIGFSTESNELSDVFFFVLRFAQKNNIDLTQAFETKMKHNAEKYPVEKAKGSNKKYNEL